MRRTQSRPPLLLTLALVVALGAAEPSAFSFPSDGGAPNRGGARPGSPLTFPQEDSGVRVTKSLLPQPFSFPNSGQQQQQRPFAPPAAPQQADTLRTQRGLRFPQQQKQKQEGGSDQDAAADGNKETRHVNFGADYDDYGGGDDGGYGAGGGGYGGGGGGYGGGGGGGGGYGGGGGGYGGGGGGYGGGYGQGGYGDQGDYGDQGQGFGGGQGGYPPAAPGGGYPHGADYDEGAAGYGGGHYPEFGEDTAASHDYHGGHDVPHNHKPEGKWKKKLIWKPRWKRVWKHAQKQAWKPKWKRTYKPIWKTTWKPSWKKIWTVGWKQMYKPVLVKQWVPGDKSHGTDYEGWEYTSHGLWKKKLVWKPFWKKYWKPGSKQVWITGKKLVWQPAWRKTWVSVWKPVKVPAWKKIWTPVWISEWLPFQDHEEVWDRKASASTQQDASSEDRTSREAPLALPDSSSAGRVSFPQVAASAAAKKSVDDKIATWSWQ